MTIVVAKLREHLFGIFSLDFQSVYFSSLCVLMYTLLSSPTHTARTAFMERPELPANVDPNVNSKESF